MTFMLFNIILRAKLNQFNKNLFLKGKVGTYIN